MEEKCKFYKKQFLSKYCELFKQPCYGKYCNFIKEFTRLNELEQQLQLKDKMIELMIESLCHNDDCNYWRIYWGKDPKCNKDVITCEECIKNKYKQQALAELENNV